MSEHKEDKKNEEKKTWELMCVCIIIGVNVSLSIAFLRLLGNATDRHVTIHQPHGIAAIQFQ